VTRSPVQALWLPTMPSTPTADIPEVGGEPITNHFAKIQRWAKQVSPLISGAGTPLVGTNPPTPPSAAYLLQGAADPIALSVLGQGTITYPQPFPNGVLDLVVSGLDGITYSIRSASLALPGGLSGFQVQGWNGPSATYPTGTQTVVYQAIGW
jgi:hypothetical protein